MKLDQLIAYIMGYIFRQSLCDLTLFIIEGQKAPPTSFGPITSTDIGNSPQIFLTFSFKPFSVLV